MTKAKIAISLPKAQLDRVHREVRAGRADSVSGYITRVLEDTEKKDSLQQLLQEMVAELGEPSAEDVAWAESVLPPPKRRH